MVLLLRRIILAVVFTGNGTLSRRDGIKNRATPRDTIRFTITTAAKSLSLTFDSSSRKKITESAPTVVRVAAIMARNTFLLPWCLR